MTELPSPLHRDPVVDLHQKEKANSELLRIAWRYQDLPDKNIPIFGNTYDLGHIMKSSTVEKVEIIHGPPPSIQGNTFFLRLTLIIVDFYNLFTINYVFQILEIHTMTCLIS